jgi:hypothetical protein
MFRYRSYESLQIEDDGIEMIENKAIVRRCWTYIGDLSTLIYFHRNSLGIGVLLIPFEYILSMHIQTDNTVALTTCIHIVGDTAVKVDKVTNIYLDFVHSKDLDSFRKRLYDGMLFCKQQGQYDRSVFNLNIVKRFFKMRGPRKVV